ncbi:MAG: hypothetical protein WC176_05390 [Candidatus Cloacimonadaceae bacterium]
MGKEFGDILYYLRGERKEMSVIDFNLSKDAVQVEITDEYVGYIFTATKYCLVKNTHSPGVVANITGGIVGGIRLYWEPLSQKQQNTMGDPGKATEKAAEGIAFIVIDKFTKYKIGIQAFVGSGFDFYLFPKDIEASLSSFNNDCLKLEISGIDKKSSTNKVETRIKQKCQQASRIKDSIPYYVIVAEFSDPAVEVKHGYSI